MLNCGHDEKDWRSICSAHQRLRDDCGRCNTGRCITCIPKIESGDRFPTFDRKTGGYVNAFPNLGVCKDTGRTPDRPRADTVDLRCDCCGTPMAMEPLARGSMQVKGARFKCQRPSCGQTWTFSENGSSCTILAFLYPSEMREDSKIYRKFLDYRLSEFSFRYKACLLCGLITPQEYKRNMGEVEKAVSEKIQEIKRKKPWWKRIFSGESP